MKALLYIVPSLLIAAFVAWVIWEALSTIRGALAAVLPT